MQHNLNDIGGAKDIAKYRIETAQADLRAAIRNLDEEDYRTANNRAYYAIYHAVSACLALDFKSFKRHGQAIGEFNKCYIHTGIFSSALGAKISEAKDVRHQSDYDDFYIVSVEETKRQIDTAEEVINVITEFLEAKLDNLNE